MLDRAHKVSEAALDRQLKLDLQDDQQDWKTSEAALDRAHQLAMLQAKSDREDELEADRIDRLTLLQNSDVPPYSQWDVDV
jgi:hypothetical protein